MTPQAEHTWLVGANRPVLAKARLVIVVAFGSSKTNALREALAHEGSALPVAELLRSAPSSLVLADEAAGGM